MLRVCYDAAYGTDAVPHATGSLQKQWQVHDHVLDRNVTFNFVAIHVLRQQDKLAFFGPGLSTEAQRLNPKPLTLQPHWVYNRSQPGLQVLAAAASSKRPYVRVVFPLRVLSGMYQHCKTATPNAGYEVPGTLDTTREFSSAFDPGP